MAIFETLVSACPIKGRTAINPRKNAPRKVIRPRTLPKNSAVFLPGLIPGTKPPCFWRLSATLFGSKTIEV